MEKQAPISIGVMFTGGTIGSHMGEAGYITTDQQAPYRLLSMFTDYYEQNKEKYETEITFHPTEPYQILSENLRSENLIQLVQAVDAYCKSEQGRSSKGLIITHGTDTIQYTAAILGYLFSNAGIPILLVSSAYVLEDSRENGLANFVGAIDFIMEKKAREGVFVSYRNDDGILYFHRGTRMQNPFSFSADMYSVKESWYSKRVLGQDFGHKQVSQPTQVSRLPIEPANLRLATRTDAICRIHPCPGMTYPILQKNVKAVLMESFHSGTVAVDEALQAFMEQANSLRIPVYLVGLDNSVDLYETASAYQNLGLLALPCCAAIAQYCKLWILTSNDLDIRYWMGQNVAFDWVI